MTDTPDLRRYAVMTRSHRPGDTSLLALRDGGNSHNGGFWTDDRSEEVALLSLDDATDKVASLRLNNPQVHRAEKALKIITDQRDAKRALAVALPPDVPVSDRIQAAPRDVDLAM